jgi:hypothetical protein
MAYHAREAYVSRPVEFLHISTHTKQVYTEVCVCGGTNCVWIQIIELHVRHTHERVLARGYTGDVAVDDGGGRPTVVECVCARG